MTYHIHPYDRYWDLDPLINVTDKEINDTSIEGHHNIINKLERKKTDVKHAGKINHWSYNKSIHVGLVKAIQEEKKSLNELLDQQEAA